MSTPDKPLTGAQADSLAAPSEPWFSCEDCFDHIDGYVDALIGGGRGIDEPLRVHLARCPACYEEAESLISLAAGDQGARPERVVAAFRADLGRPVDARVERKGAIVRLFRRNRPGEAVPPP